MRDERQEWYKAVAVTAAMFLPDRELCYAVVDAGVEMGVIDTCDAEKIKERIDYQLETGDVGTGTR